MVKKKADEKLELKDITEDSETIKRFKQERLRRKDACDINFWCCLVFQSFEQKREFLEALSEFEIPTLYEGQYVDGQSMAGALGIEVTPNECPPDKNPFNKRLAELVNVDALKKGARKSQIKRRS